MLVVWSFLQLSASRLILLLDKEVWPIAMRERLGRLTAKCICFLKKNILAKFSPAQHGMGGSGHSVHQRNYLWSLSSSRPFSDWTYQEYLLILYARLTCWVRCHQCFLTFHLTSFRCVLMSIPLSFCKNIRQRSFKIEGNKSIKGIPGSYAILTCNTFISDILADKTSQLQRFSLFWCRLLDLLTEWGLLLSGWSQISFL